MTTQQELIAIAKSYRLGNLEAEGELLAFASDRADEFAVAYGHERMPEKAFETIADVREKHGAGGVAELIAKQIEGEAKKAREKARDSKKVLRVLPKEIGSTAVVFEATNTQASFVAVYADNGVVFGLSRITLKKVATAVKSLSAVWELDSERKALTVRYETPSGRGRYKLAIDSICPVELGKVGEVRDIVAAVEAAEASELVEAPAGVESAIEAVEAPESVEEAIEAVEAPESIEEASEAVEAPVGVESASEASKASKANKSASRSEAALRAVATRKARKAARLGAKAAANPSDSKLRKAAEAAAESARLWASKAGLGEADGSASEAKPERTLTPYQERQMERAEARAQRLRSQAEAAAERAHATLAPIPPGQPILIGHHSERAHRRAIDKADRAMRQAVELSRAAEQASGSRAGYAISADDPDAIEALQAKLERLQEKRERIKADNRARRGTHPAFVLQNLGANIRRVKARIEELSRAAERASEPEAVTMQGEGYRVEECPADNRIRIHFESKPDAQTRALVKRWGFRWSPRNQAWQRMLSGQGRSAATLVHRELSI